MTLNTTQLPLDSARTSPLRRWGMIGLVFIGQLAVIYWLGYKRPAPLRSSPVGLSLRLLDGVPGTNLALMDPTLFALPHKESFAGPAWMISVPQEIPSYTWSESPRWLTNSIARLGSSFHEATAPGSFSLLDAIAGAPAIPRLPESGFAESFGSPSTWKLTDDLANRHLLATPELRSWTSTELLTDSIVRLVVDARGRPISVNLLPPGSGSKDADQEAMAIAAQLRFEPLPTPVPGNSPNPLDSMRWGYLILEWQTLPVPDTNAPVGTK